MNKQVMSLAVDNPNLSVILPVGCNAKCKFCYWEKGTGLTTDRFQFVANTLPQIFEQASITGGETTLSRDLVEYLKIAKRRFKKVVLNTNGYNLTKDHIELADFVNISRHHFDDNENEKVFGVSTVPNSVKLKEFCSYGDITLNCVIPDGFEDKEFIDNYIQFAKDCGAKVAFRKYFNNLNTLTEIDTDDTLEGEHSCGACLHRWHTIDGVNVTFKYSVKETFEHVDGIYELILQSNGDLTYDWNGNNKLTYKGD